MAGVVGNHTSRHESRAVHVDAAAVCCRIVIDQAAYDLSVFAVYAAATGIEVAAGVHAEVAVANGAVAHVGAGVGHVYAGSAVGRVVGVLRLRLAALNDEAFEVDCATGEC